MELPTPWCSSARHSWSLQGCTTVNLNWTGALHCYMQWMDVAPHPWGAGGPPPFSLTAQILMLAKPPRTQLTMHTHPSAGVFNLLKFALSHEEEVSRLHFYFQNHLYLLLLFCCFCSCDVGIWALSCAHNSSASTSGLLVLYSWLFRAARKKSNASCRIHCFFLTHACLAVGLFFYSWYCSLVSIK